MVDGLIVLDIAQGRPLVRSSFAHLPPALPLIHVDAYLAARPAPPPLIPLLPPAPPAAACHISYDSLALIAPISHNADPLLAFALLDTFASLLLHHLNASSLSPALIRDNYHLVFHLIEELLQHNVPSTTDPSMLRDILLPDTFINKIMSISPVANIAKSSQSPFTSPIPWRQAGIRHNANEIFFDIMENLDCLVSRSGTILDTAISGEVRVNSRLSGTPDLGLTFRNAEIVSNELFHQCVRIPKWTRDKLLSFIPPDGRFSLMTYQYKAGGERFSAPPDILPFALRCSLTCTGNAASLDVALTSKSRDTLERVSVEFVAGVGVTGATCNVSAGSKWGFDPKGSVIQWDISSVAPSSSHTMKSSFSSRDALRPHRSLIVKFHLANRPFSPLKVDQLRVSGENYKPYKGIRGSGRGTVEWRL